jgi:phenylacetyl-CoA:acceptor oxidoreductase subunit 1
MVVDLNRCVGCQTCAVACKHENATLPGVQWRQVLDVEQGEFPSVERLFLVVGCQHCAEPPCVPVCPTGATAQRADGMVTMDYELCIGCAACAVACPYQARTIVHDQRWYYGVETVQERAVAHHERRGVAQKCSFCVDRVDAGLARGLKPGVDPAATPACAASCIAQALHFGDFADPESNVSGLARDNASFQMHEALGSDPQIRYLYDMATTPGRDPAPQDTDDEAMSQLENPLAGARQRFWDYKGAMNFVFGGIASGFAVIAFVIHLLGGITGAALAVAYVVAGLVMAVGLTALLFKIGRPLRALNATRRPQSSWMSRELYAVVAFYPLVLADLLWPSAVLHALVALAAAGFLVCQARILHASKGVPTWRAPLVPWMLTLTGLYEGAGLVAIAHALFPGGVPGGASLAALGLALAVVNAALWRRYCGSAKAAGIGPLARRDLARLTPWLHGVGHLLPGLLFLAAIAWPGLPAVLTYGLAGAAVVAGGALWKFALVTRICHLQGFALPKVPRRGSGAYAAPPRLEAA